MRLHISVGLHDCDEWQPVSVFEPSIVATHGPDVLTWNCDVTLPTGERTFIGAVYAKTNRTTNLVAKQNGVEVVSVFAFKTKESAYDPTIIFRTSAGAYVQVMLGD